MVWPRIIWVLACASGSAGGDRGMDAVMSAADDAGAASGREDPPPAVVLVSAGASHSVALLGKRPSGRGKHFVERLAGASI